MTLIGHVTSSLFLLFGAASVVEAFPSGAGGCSSGMAAVRSLHLSRPQINGTLAQGNLKLVVQGRDVPPSKNTINLMLDSEYTIGVRRTDGKTFRGVLLRVEDPSVMPIGALMFDPQDGDSNLQSAMACLSEAPAIGLTHTNNTDKTNVMGVLQYILDADVAANDVKGVTLDVTVVIRLDAQSEYYYTPYILNFLSATPVPTKAPKKNTKAPVPTKHPVATKAPKKNTKAPIPTKHPVATKAPKKTTKAPVPTKQPFATKAPKKDPQPPVPTKQPVVTKAPKKDTQPAVPTKQPVVTKAPEKTTKAPVRSKQPVVKKSPKKATQHPGPRTVAPVSTKKLVVTELPMASIP